MENDEIETLAEYVADSLWLCAVADAVERAADGGDPGARDFRPGAGGGPHGGTFPVAIRNGSATLWQWKS